MVTTDIVYQRGGVKISGKDAWCRFFRSERNADGTMSGKHTVITRHFDKPKNMVVATGEFLKPGQNEPIRFVDIMFYAPNGPDKGLVYHRESYFLEGGTTLQTPKN